ncbi:YlxR family protein [Paraliomyxa miuraensis]|uniref:YlxR family protein n=1 Tax=Paraliomyxa miuraensis TaxID=376150 RepID=UPI00224EDA40|nr:YlxR family protein [Paraliomyxa miuraensis]MCX4244630.1 YlxR family protein [Paraliomyxa miuraensis]
MSEPVRICVACRTRRPQRALVRLRRRSDGVVVPAVGRHTRGRSAYLCPSRSCFERALKRRALERSLGSTRSEPLAQRGCSPSRPRVLGPDLEALWPSVAAALDHEIQNMQRSGDNSQNPRYDALVELRGGLGTPGRSA